MEGNDEQDDDARAAANPTIDENRGGTTTTTTLSTPTTTKDTTTTFVEPTTTTNTLMGRPTTTTAAVSPSLLNENYYHGLLPREDVELLLRENGDYLVRISQPRANDNEKQIIISVQVDKNRDKGLRHIVVRKHMGKYQIEDSSRFDSIKDLIDHFVQNRKPVLPALGETTLLNPIERQIWELRHSDIELTKKIGSGVYGEVYKGKLKRKNSEVEIAVKTALVAALTKEGSKEIMREARMMRNYLHPNVVRSYGVALEDDPIMIVMELVKGGALSGYLRKHAKISDNEKLINMVSGASWGLQYLHSRKCIHRDIAARNCLYDKNKGVKISDFGLSREGKEYKMNTTQRVPIKWIAPECLVTFTFTKASDVFSYGVLLWEIYTNGADPFVEKKPSEIKAMLINGERLEFPATTPPEIKEMVTQRMWNTKPEERYTMSDIVQKLEQLSGVKQPSTTKRHHKEKSKYSKYKSQYESNVSMNVTMDPRKPSTSSKKSNSRKRSHKE